MHESTYANVTGECNKFGKEEAPQPSQLRGHKANTICFFIEYKKNIHSRGLEVKTHLAGAKGGAS